jgi:ABC-type transport system involved in cytochrome bd biosynthesis fused ATPase/permease subunit
VTPLRPQRSLVAPAAALLRGGGPGLAIVAAAALGQRIALPLSALWLGDRGERAAAAVLVVASLLAFVRARASDALARVVRLHLVDLYLRPLAEGPAVPPPAADAVVARLATALPVLVSWAVDGVAVVVAAAVAVPLVALLLGAALGALALVPLGVAGLVGAGITMAASGRVEAAWSRSFDHARALLEDANAALAGAAELRAHGRGGEALAGVRGEVVAWSGAELGARTTSALSSWGAMLATLLAALAAAALLGPGAALFRTGDGSVYRSFLLILSAVPTLQMLVSGVASLAYARGELEAVGAILPARPGSNDEADAAAGKVDPRAALRLEDVTFGYARGDEGAASPAIRALSFTLPAGESLAVVGPNGAGKTTLLYLLLGLARPQHGRVRLGDREVIAASIARGAVAFVSQRPFELPRGTVADNLRAFDPDAPDTRLLAALDAVGLRATLCARAGSDAAALALPYASLSRGQARRLLLARALVRDAELIVLDEPEAHLDAEGRAELDALLRRLARDRRIVAAIHDRALTGFAHRVLTLAQGGTIDARAETSLAVSAP